MVEQMKTDSTDMAVGRMKSYKGVYEIAKNGGVEVKLNFATMFGTTIIEAGKTVKVTKETAEMLFKDKIECQYDGWGEGHYTKRMVARAALVI